MVENEEYIKKLISEAMEEAFGKKPSFQFVDDEGDDNQFDDDYQEPGDVETGEQTETPRKGERGSAFRGPEYMRTRNQHKGQIDRLRSDNAATRATFNNDAFGMPWTGSKEKANNPYNNAKKDVLEPDQFGRVKVRFQFVMKPKSPEYKEPLMLIELLNIDPEDCVEIAKKFTRYNHTQYVWVPKVRQNNEKDGKPYRDGVVFYVYNSVLDLWKQEDLEEIIDFIGAFKNEDGTPKYYRDEQDKENLRQYVLNRVVSGRDLSEYFSNAKQNNIELFNAFIEAENDDKVQEFIKKYQRFGLINKICSELGLDFSFGRIISVQNASLVLGSGRQTGAGVPPTFILTEKIWRKMFGRIVNPTAVPFYIWVPNERYEINKEKEQQFTSKPYKVKGENGEDIEINKTEDVLNTFFFGKKWNELSEQQKISAAVLCNFINPSKCYPMAEYDVSDTTFVPGLLKQRNGTPITDDLFNTQVGLTNRFSGEMNQAAAELVKQQQKNAGAAATDGSENGDEDVDLLKMFADDLNEYALKEIDEYCQSKNISYPKNEENISLSIINALRTIARPYITQKKGSNAALLVDDAVYTTCLLMRIALDAVKILKTTKIDDMTFAQFEKALGVLMDVINGRWKQEVKRQEEPTVLRNVSESVVDGEEDNNEENPFKDKVYSPLELKVFATKALGGVKTANDMFESLMERMDKSKTNLIY